ncbi:peroxiredoxin [Zavarzinia compransoris]|uniref:thioredoxin-dependent peroxiredoxin n=1 Tax=Zavarzinia compransoris TaxID=1264899 RepID=A0A317EC82_9PROT|nr:peroxiredoxin [Zavarzinia compransoris]PWR23740.1 peroxiredoxin [Zavarzinia compransoris]TDP47965.1 peroxiredoxin Q/BCP [Zavarzinia compransoris]
MSSEPHVGAPAPAFTLPTNGGGSVSLAALAGRKVVLYFYPKDDTPGCTTEAIDFTARIADFEAAGAVVVGVSRDSVAAHDKFAKKHQLAVTLGADLDGAATEAYGVWVEKNMYGRQYFGIERATFLIDGQGEIARIWRKVKVKGHVDEVLEAARAL